MARCPAPIYREWNIRSFVVTKVVNKEIDSLLQWWSVA